MPVFVFGGWCVSVFSSGCFLPIMLLRKRLHRPTKLMSLRPERSWSAQQRLRFQSPK